MGFYKLEKNGTKYTIAEYNGVSYVNEMSTESLSGTSISFCAYYRYGNTRCAMVNNDNTSFFYFTSDLYISNSDIVYNNTGASIAYKTYYDYGNITLISSVQIPNGKCSTLTLNYPADTNSNFKWSNGTNPCIHPDMLVDAAGVKISELTEFPDEHFKQLMIFGKTNDFVRIKKDALANNIPSADLLLTPGHPIVFKGKESKASELVNNKTIVREKLAEPVHVYALMFTDARKCVKIHNVDVVQWKESEWLEFLENH